MKKTRKLLVVLVLSAAALALSTSAFLAFSGTIYVDENNAALLGRYYISDDAATLHPNYINVMTQFQIPQLDLRGYGYTINHFVMQDWFLDRLNYHRENYGIHPYVFYIPAIVTSIEHSLDMRDNQFSTLAAHDGRTHQQRHDRRMGVARTKVTSAHVSTHQVVGPLTEARAHEIIDTILSWESSHSFLMNPTYYYIGFGFSIQACGTGRLSITMASQEDEWVAHRMRTVQEREEHRQEVLERVRAERGWTPN